MTRTKRRINHPDYAYASAQFTLIIRDKSITECSAYSAASSLANMLILHAVIDIKTDCHYSTFRDDLVKKADWNTLASYCIYEIEHGMADQGAMLDHTKYTGGSYNYDLLGETIKKVKNSPDLVTRTGGAISRGVRDDIERLLWREVAPPIRKFVRTHTKLVKSYIKSAFIGSSDYEEFTEKYNHIIHDMYPNYRDFVRVHTLERAVAEANRLLDDAKAQAGPACTEVR